MYVKILSTTPPARSVQDRTPGFALGFRTWVSCLALSGKQSPIAPDCHKGQDTKSQEPDLHTWANAHDDEAVWYRDTFTGTTMDRPGLERLLADVRQGKIDKVVVWRLDRLGRTAKGLLTLLDELQQLGVGFVSLREGFDLNTPAGRLMAGVLASVAAYETEVRKERQLAGIAKAKAEGKTWGGRRPGTRIKLTEEKEALVRQLHAEGKPVAAIARMVGLTRKTVYRAIKEPFHLQERLGTTFRRS
ncbi:MAG: helix-turn-helix domain-containing protein [Nitrospira sp.]|nr:helix-turn-helix domain-containing protein [Nitrospira sp.]